MNKSLLLALVIALSLGATYMATKEQKSSKFEEWKLTYGIQ
jgi:hypothetical protein